MLLKNHLIEVFKKASLENNILLKENIVLRWVHRFGIDSLNDLYTHAQDLREYKHEDQEQTTLMNELDEEANQEQIKLELNHPETSISNGIFNNDQNSNNIKELPDIRVLPLPNIKNLRKWISKDKKAS